MGSFGEMIRHELENYVYALVDPDNGQIFYVGRGTGDRIFDHVKEAKNTNLSTAKVERIRKIWRENKQVNYLLIRHKLTPAEAKIVESSVIDTLRNQGSQLTNEILGQHSEAFGLRRLSELRAHYEAPELKHIDEGCVLININKNYQRGACSANIYEATRESWVISKKRIGNPDKPKLQFVLSEYRQLIVEVFAVTRWFEIVKPNQRVRWGFDGVVAPEEIRQKFLNKRIIKKPGMRNPITFNIPSY